MTPPLVSVLMTAYNREKYIAEAIESVLNSTFTDFELIVVDDQSQDRTVKIARAYETQDERVRVSVNERNLGDYPNRNRAASLAKGTYLKYVDADDLIYTHALFCMVDAMERSPDVGFGLSGRIIDPPAPYPIIMEPKVALKRHYLGDSDLSSGPTASIIRRSLFEEVGGFSGKQFIGDSELWLRLAERGPVASLPPALVWWRQHDGQQMSLELSRPEIVAQRFLMEREHLRKTTHLSNEERCEAIARLEQHVARTVFAELRKTGRLADAWKRFRDCGISWPRLLSGLRKYR